MTYLWEKRAAQWPVYLSVLKGKRRLLPSSPIKIGAMNSFIFKCLSVSILLLISHFQLYSQETQAASWTPELQMKLKTLGTPKVSPDGKKVVYTVTSPVMTADKSEFNTQIWIANTDGTNNQPLT